MGKLHAVDYTFILKCFFALRDEPWMHEFFKSINIPRLEAGLIAPPWLPKPNVVYTKDTGNIQDFSEVKGVEFDASDENFFLTNSALGQCQFHGNRR